MAVLLLLSYLVSVAVIADDENANRLIETIHRRRLPSKDLRTENPCRDYKDEAQTRILHCASHCHGLSFSSICYYSTYKQNNEWYRVIRMSDDKNHLSSAASEAGCGNGIKRAKNQYSQVTRRHMCGNARVYKIKDTRDDYCSNNNYKCVCKGKKCLWQCAFKYGESIYCSNDKYDCKEHPVIEKDGVKVKGEERREDHPKLGYHEETWIWTWATPTCEAGTVKSITGEDIKMPLLKKMFAKKKKEDRAMNELYDEMDYYYEEEDELKKDELEYLKGYVAGARAAKRMKH